MKEQTREELCVKACEGIESDDLVYILSTGRNLCLMIEELELIKTGLKAGVDKAMYLAIREGKSFIQ
jgi:hypothetical protein